MSWEKVKLGDVTDSCLGKMLDQKKNKGTYKPYLANINVRWGSFDLENLQEMRFEDDEDERYGIKFGDLIVCEGGEPGRCAIWKEQIPNMKIQKALHRVRVNEEMDYRYLYYWFLLAGKQRALRQYYTGATIMHMPGQKLKEVVIDKPPLDVQMKIGEYLEAYDKLIENNQKQIKLLEEAAQRLYKEWFVDLRFPGYEETEIVDDIPMGWQELDIDQQYEIKYGKTLPTSKISDKGRYPVYGASKVIGYYGEKNISNRTVLITSRGNAGTVYRTHHKEAFITNNSFIVTPRFEDLHIPFIYYQMQELNFKAITTGSCQPQLTNNSISMKKTILPEQSVLKRFNDYTDGYYEQIEKLLNENSLLIEARDRLLPKLMSGEIEV